MTDTKTFEVITTQEEFDERIKARLAREREKWEKESSTEDLKAQLEAKDRELVQLEKTRTVDRDLTGRGLDGAKIERIKRLLDFDGDTAEQLEALSKDVPELFKAPGPGAGSGGSSRPVLTAEKPLTREEVENMNPDQVNSNWNRVRAFLGGERG